jgi:hypothetical protein
MLPKKLTFLSSSVRGPICLGGSIEDGEGELEGERSSSGSSILPRDQSSSVVSLGIPSLPVGPLSLTDLRISDSWIKVVLGSNQRETLVDISIAEL